VQLNVALQTEIVRFTVLGIQKAIRDVEESMAEQERNSTGGTSFFVSDAQLLAVQCIYCEMTLLCVLFLVHCSIPAGQERPSPSC